MNRITDTKIEFLFKNNNFVTARFTRVFKHWMFRGFAKREKTRAKREKTRISDLNNPRTELEEFLKWDQDIDGTFIDRDGVSLLMYAVCMDHLDIASYLLKEINEHFKNDSVEKQRRIESRIPLKGFIHVGITGSCTALIVAMTIASPAMVDLLLENGANPHDVDMNGNNVFICACATNRLDNVKFWLQRFPDWNLDARNTVVGGIALGCAVLLGQNRYELTEFLLNRGANMILTDSGSSILLSACDSEDADPRVVRLILDRLPSRDLINFRRTSRTLKWKIIRTLAKLIVKCQTSPSHFIYDIAQHGGVTAIQTAALRGDMEIVELMLRQGADPNIRNDLGQDAASMCRSFPELQGLLRKRQRMCELRGTQKNYPEALGKRISTAIPIQHDMWLISLDTMLMLYGKGSRGHVMEVHQELRDQEFLVNWRDVPSDAEIIFVSHEWLSWAHPDPDGVQLRVLCRILERLRKGGIGTEMTAMHTLLYVIMRAFSQVFGLLHSCLSALSHHLPNQLHHSPNQFEYECIQMYNKRNRLQV